MIGHVYAVLVQTVDGQEQVVATQSGPQWTPMLYPEPESEPDFLAWLTRQVSADPALLGKEVTVMRYTNREVVATVDRRQETPPPKRKAHSPFEKP